MEQKLREFNGDTHMKEAVMAFILETINQVALEKMYAKQDVSHIADAYALITKSFANLDHEYGIKERPTAPINQAK